MYLRTSLTNLIGHLKYMYVCEIANNGADLVQWHKDLFFLKLIYLYCLSDQTKKRRVDVLI